MKKGTQHYPLRWLLAASVFLLTSLPHRTAAEATKEDQRNQAITITTWNIEHLGTSGRGFGGGYGGFGKAAIPERGYELSLRSDTDLANIARLIQDEIGSDVLALQELGITSRYRNKSNCAPLTKIVSNLNNEAGDWSYYIPPVEETPTKDSEDNTHLGFMWNKDRVRLLNAFEMGLPRIEMAGKALFERAPLVGYFETIRDDGKPGNDFALVNVHFGSGQDNDENHLIAMTLIEYELASSLSKHAITESDIIILGDFNDNPTAKSKDGSRRYSPAMYEHMKFKGYTNLVTNDLQTSRLNKGLDSLIDHIFVNKSIRKDVPQDKADLYRPYSFKAKPGLWAAWRQSYSDHLPISIKLLRDRDTDTDFFE